MRSGSTARVSVRRSSFATSASASEFAATTAPDRADRVTRMCKVRSWPAADGGRRVGSQQVSSRLCSRSPLTSYTQVRTRPAGKRLTVRKRRPGDTPHDYSYKHGKHPVDVTAIDHVLHIDRESGSRSVRAKSSWSSCVRLRCLSVCCRRGVSAPRRESPRARPAEAPELRPAPLWRLSAFMHRFRSPGAGFSTGRAVTSGCRCERRRAGPGLCRDQKRSRSAVGGSSPAMRRVNSPMRSVLGRGPARYRARPR